MTRTLQVPVFQSKLPDTQISIFTRMTELALKHGAINLSQGFPDFHTDKRLVNLVTKYMNEWFNQYAPMVGVQALRHRIAEKYQQFYHISVDGDAEVTITSGGTQALFTAIATVVHPGDEVIIFEPAYDSYRPAVEVFGGKVVAVKLLAPDFSIDWAYVKSLISDKTKLIILNNPNNPTARCMTHEDIKGLESVVADTSICILSDEVYEHIVFDGKKHVSVLSSTKLRERVFVVASFGKLLHTTGWKLGYIVGSAVLMREFRKVHQFNVFSASTPMQMAIADYLDDMDYYTELSDFFQKKRDYFSRALETSRFRILPSEGTYFMLLDYSAISDLPEMDFATVLAERHKVASVPVSAFYRDGQNQQLLRVCFAKKEETLDSALEYLSKI